MFIVLSKPTDHSRWGLVTIEHKKQLIKLSWCWLKYLPKSIFFNENILHFHFYSSFEKTNQKPKHSAKDKLILVMHVKTYLILFFSYSRIK